MGALGVRRSGDPGDGELPWGQGDGTLGGERGLCGKELGSWGGEYTLGSCWGAGLWGRGMGALEGGEWGPWRTGSGGLGARRGVGPLGREVGPSGRDGEA